MLRAGGRTEDSPTRIDLTAPLARAGHAGGSGTVENSSSGGNAAGSGVVESSSRGGIMAKLVQEVRRMSPLRSRPGMGEVRSRQWL